MAGQRTLAVIETFYDAAMDTTLWPTALKMLTALTGSQASSFWVLAGAQSPCLSTFNYINFDQTSIQEYVAHTAALDPWVRYLVTHPEASVVHDGLLGDQRDEDERKYEDWHQRHIETRFRLVGQTHLAPTVQSGVALHRTKKAGIYESDDIARFTVLHRHLKRALTIGYRLGSLGVVQRLSIERLDRSPAAIVLLDDGRRILFANRRAHALQERGDGISWSAHGIAFACQQSNRKLQSLVAQALTPTDIRDNSLGGSMRVPRPSGRRPYSVMVNRISPESSALTFVRAAVCVLILDPDAELPVPSRLLRSVFGLTQAEARLAELLIAGEELRRIAEQLQITYGSARSRLAQIFAKTDTRRQGELISLILTTLCQVN